jgi:23S rRNA maturation mini-RNase III
MANKKSKGLRSWSISLFLLGFFAFGVPIVLQELPLWLNPPSPQIVQLATATAMTEDAQKIFYRQQPKIEPKATFAQSCSKVSHGSEELIALGCFRSMSRGSQIVSGEIFIQSIVDSRFQGIMETTAAHEMLHAVYARLSSSERANLTPRLEAALQFVKDTRLISVLKQYKERDIELYHNELHSHLGTELANLGDEALEQHYRRYFTDRTQVVALAKQSQTAFRELDTKAQTLKAEIDKLEINLKDAKQALKNSEQSLSRGQQDLESMKDSLMNLKAEAEAASSSSAFGSMAQRFESSKASFNAQVNSFNAQTQNYQGEVDAFNEQVDIYKKTVAEYNAIAKEERSLLGELSATPKNYPQAPNKVNADQ